MTPYQIVGSTYSLVLSSEDYTAVSWEADFVAIKEQCLAKMEMALKKDYCGHQERQSFEPVFFVNKAPRIGPKPRVDCRARSHC